MNERKFHHTAHWRGGLTIDQPRQVARDLMPLAQKFNDIATEDERKAFWHTCREIDPHPETMVQWLEDAIYAIEHPESDAALLYFGPQAETDEEYTC